jgi:hypothetical protein
VLPFIARILATSTEAARIQTVIEEWIVVSILMLEDDNMSTRGGLGRSDG